MLPVAIIIPVYKNEMTPFEVISFQQCFIVLRNHPIIFLCPKNMELGSFHQDHKSKAKFLFIDNDNLMFNKHEIKMRNERSKRLCIY